MGTNKNTPLLEDIRRSLLPGDDDQASPSIQVALFNALERLDELMASSVKHGPAIRVLIDHWYPHRPWALDHYVAKERLIAMYIAIFFLENVTRNAPELILPHGFTLKDAIQSFEITAEALNVAVRYQMHTDSMSPQLTPGTKVLVVKTKTKEWTSLMGVVLINRHSHLNKETLGRIVKVTQRTVYIRPDNRQWPKVAIPRRDIMALYAVSYIVGKKVL